MSDDFTDPVQPTVHVELASALLEAGEESRMLSEGRRTQGKSVNRSPSAQR
jgi:hypothetical protein